MKAVLEFNMRASSSLFLILLSFFSGLTDAYPDCRNIEMSDGELTTSTNLELRGLIFPNSFQINLKPSRECYYIANDYIKLDWDDGAEIDGSIFEYGFTGWDGKNPQTCTLSKR